jgi:hypothetical protein
MRSLRAARRGGHDRARSPAVSAVSTAGSWVLVVVRVSCSSAAASLSQADFLRDRKISQPAASATTTRISSVQPKAANPWDSAAADVPAADVAGGVVGELGRSAEVGVGVAVLVRVGRVGAVPHAGVGASAGAFGRGAGRRVVPVAGAATAEPNDQAQDEPGQQPCPGGPAAKDRCSHPPVPVPGRGRDPPRQQPRRPHPRPPPDRPGEAGEPRPAGDTDHTSVRGPSRHHPKRMRIRSRTEHADHLGSAAGQPLTEHQSRFTRCG